jgi:hypothetical protein
VYYGLAVERTTDTKYQRRYITMTHTTNKQIKQAQRVHENATACNLWQVYGNYSHAKQRAFEYCLELMNKYRGSMGRILTYNTFCFSFGFIGEINGKSAFFYITRDNDRYIYFDELYN